MAGETRALASRQKRGNPPPTRRRVPISTPGSTPGWNQERLSLSRMPAERGDIRPGRSLRRWHPPMRQTHSSVRSQGSVGERAVRQLWTDLETLFTCYRLAGQRNCGTASHTPSRLYSRCPLCLCGERSCKTKPICGGPGERQVLLHAGVVPVVPGRRILRNKASLCHPKGRGIRREDADLPPSEKGFQKTLPEPVAWATIERQ